MKGSLAALFVLTSLTTTIISPSERQNPCLTVTDNSEVCLYQREEIKKLGLEKKVVVDLSQQRLYAYEGKYLVYYAKVSTGLPNTPTITGTFRIYLKLVKARMRGGIPNTPGYYDTPDVPFTQYFYGGYAIHGAYWHHDFGQVRSHGCVNLEPSDAEWLFDWTGPVLPEGASQLVATKDNPGTIVQVIE